MQPPYSSNLTSEYAIPVNDIPQAIPIPPNYQVINIFIYLIIESSNESNTFELRIFCKSLSKIR